MYKYVLRTNYRSITMAVFAGTARRRGAGRSGDELQGLGLLLLDAVRSLDIYLVMGSVLIGTVLLLVGNLLADIALVRRWTRAWTSRRWRHNERAGRHIDGVAEGRGYHQCSRWVGPRVVAGVAHRTLFRDLPPDLDPFAAISPIRAHRSGSSVIAWMSDCLLMRPLSAPNGRRDFSARIRRRTVDAEERNHAPT